MTKRLALFVRVPEWLPDSQRAALVLDVGDAVAAYGDLNGVAVPSLELGYVDLSECPAVDVELRAVIARGVSVVVDGDSPRRLS